MHCTTAYGKAKIIWNGQTITDTLKLKFLRQLHDSKSKPEMTKYENRNSKGRVNTYALLADLMWEEKFLSVVLVGYIEFNKDVILIL